ncbi:MAG: hypothetical protein ACXU9V_05580 [Gemmatimonadaceae bacterium]
MLRIPTGVKLAVIVSAHIATCLGIGVAVASTMHFKSARSVLGAQYSLALFLVPNVLSLAISAWIMRARWAQLRLAQLVAAGFSLGLVTIVMMFAFVLLFVPFLGIPLMYDIGPRVAMIAPGIIAAQLLRVGTNRSDQAPAA